MADAQLTPERAHTILLLWNSFVGKYPEINIIKTHSEWSAWLEKHPNIQNQNSLWNLHEIAKKTLEQERKEPEKKEEKEKHEQHHFVHHEETHVEETKKNTSPQDQNQQSEPDIQDVMKRIEQAQREDAQAAEREFSERQPQAPRQTPQEAPQPRPEPSSQAPRPSGGNSPEEQLARDEAKNIARKAAQNVARAGARLLLANPYFWIILGIVIIIIIVFIIVFSSGGEQKPTNATPIPGLSITLTGPPAVKNAQEINYAIAVTYAGPLEVIINDPIPTNATFDAATGKYEIINNVVTWKLKENIGSEITHIYEFGVAFKPNKEDSIVKNKVFANSLGSPGNPNATDFDTLMVGQGRNIGVLGSEDMFTTQALKNAGQYNLANREVYLRQIYKASVARNVNPLIVLTTWGTEQGFGAPQRAFSCPPRIDTGFEAQLACAVATWDNWMKYFDQNKSADGTVSLQSSLPGNMCVYSDPFLFAAEKYGPVCSAYDANEHFHSSFVKFYKQFSQP